MENTKRSKKTGVSKKKLEAKVTKEIKDYLDALIKLGWRLWYQKISDRFTSGLPDFIVCCYGYFIAIEVKREGDKPKNHPWQDFALAEPIQAFTLQKISNADGNCVAVDNVEDVRQLLNAVSLLKRLN